MYTYIYRYINSILIQIHSTITHTHTHTHIHTHYIYIYQFMYAYVIYNSVTDVQYCTRMWLLQTRVLEKLTVTKLSKIFHFLKRNPKKNLALAPNLSQMNDIRGQVMSFQIHTFITVFLPTIRCSVPQISFRVCC
jgi:hypothetical protein